jgi:hypothetical protein
MTLTKEEQIVWDHYFGHLCGWTMHPGYSADYYRENAAKPTMQECADIATDMIEIRRGLTKS